MLKIIQQRIDNAINFTLDDAQAGFPASRSTAEQVCDLRIIGEKYIEHQMKMYNNFIDFKKSFDRVWHDALWAVLEKHGIDFGIIRVMKNLYAQSVSAVEVSGSNSELFKCGVGVRQRCILSPMLFNAFLEEIASRANEGFQGGVEVNCVVVINLRLADDIDLIASTEDQLYDWVRIPVVGTTDHKPTANSSCPSF